MSLPDEKSVRGLGFLLMLIGFLLICVGWFTGDIDTIMLIEFLGLLLFWFGVIALFLSSALRKPK
jgi:membrane-bound ClpP family serine protease